jgi:1-acyl-sn-glycerol-3-phosphate acyltransferase
MAKSELFKHRALAAIITFFNAFSVSRGAFDREAIRNSIKILEAGEIVGIFPEGTRATDGNIKEGQKGIGLISVLSKSPVIPVAISGSNMIIQKPHKRLYFPKVKIAYGEMIDTLEIIKEYGNKNAIGIIVEQTMASIKKLYNSIKN